MKGETLHQHLSDIEHAARQLIDGIYFEEDRLAALRAELNRQLTIQRDLGNAYRNSLMDQDFDDFGIGIAAYWEAYNRSPRVDAMAAEEQRLKDEVDNRSVSAAALAGALLQLAKQAMSKVHGPELSDCPYCGKSIGSQSLKAVIWQARNQSMHFEEASFRRPVRACFSILAREFGPAFSLARHQSENLALEVIKLLRWTDYAAFAADLNSLLSPSTT